MTLSSGPQFTHLSEGYSGNPFYLVGCLEQALVKTMSSVTFRKRQEDTEGQERGGEGYR